MGPSICCDWVCRLALLLLVYSSFACFKDLNALLSDGYTSKFAGILKYISYDLSTLDSWIHFFDILHLRLQHYPQNDCFGKHLYDIPYYIQHPNSQFIAILMNSNFCLTVSFSCKARSMAETRH